MGPKTTPSLTSKGGYQIPPPLEGREIDTPWEIGLKNKYIPRTYINNYIVVYDVLQNQNFSWLVIAL